MDLADDQQRAQWRRYLGQLVTDRRVIAGLLPLGGMDDWVELVHEAGGRRPLPLAPGAGAGAWDASPCAWPRSTSRWCASSTTSSAPGAARSMPRDVRR
jgi:hypothetical protein